MKRIVLVIIAVVFSASMAGQTMPSVSTDDVKNAGKAVVTDQSQDVDKQITEALMKDEGLQEDTVEYLQENEDTSDAITEIIEENEDSLSGIMEAVLGDSSLSAAAIDFIKNNPEMLQKAMKIIGM